MTLLSCPSWGLVVGFGTSTVTSHRFRQPSEKGHEMKALFAWVLEQQPEILRVGRMSTPFLRGTWAAHCPLATWSTYGRKKEVSLANCNTFISYPLLLLSIIFFMNWSFVYCFSWNFSRTHSKLLEGRDFVLLTTVCPVPKTGVDKEQTLNTYLLNKWNKWMNKYNIYWTFTRWGALNF